MSRIVNLSDVECIDDFGISEMMYGNLMPMLVDADDSKLDNVERVLNHIISSARMIQRNIDYVRHENNEDGRQ